MKLPTVSPTTPFRSENQEKGGPTTPPVSSAKSVRDSIDQLQIADQRPSAIFKRSSVASELRWGTCIVRGDHFEAANFVGKSVGQKAFRDDEGVRQAGLVPGIEV